MIDAGEVAEVLRLVDQDQRGDTALLDSLAELPVITERLTGASTVDLVLDDPDDTHLAALAARLWMVAAGRHWELVAVRRVAATGRLRVTFEDALVAALRARTGLLVVPAGSTTLAELTVRLCREAGAAHRVDPTLRELAGVAERNPEATSVGYGWPDTWQLLGHLWASVGGRRFSDGTSLIAGSDDWLLSHPAVPVSEDVSPVGPLDAALDGGRPTSTARLEVAADGWIHHPGTVVDVSGSGPLDGPWLIDEVIRTVTVDTATVKLTRGRHVFTTHDPLPTALPGSEAGSPDFLPRPGVWGESATAPTPRDRMLRWAAARVGRPYRVGGVGPGAYDASGFVEGATTAGGRRLARPGTAQWDTARNQGQVLTVAEGIATRGAILFGADSPHGAAVAISLGNGSTVEALGPAHGVTVAGGAEDREWKGAVRWL